MTTAERLNKVDETAPRLRSDRNAVYALVRSGELRHVRIGRKILIPESALIEFMERGGYAGRVSPIENE